MALALKDRVKETTTTTGTGTVTLAGAAAGFQSFVVIGDGNQTFYAIVDSASGDWEVGVGTYTASGTTLSRTTVVSSSNAGSLVNFGAGSKDVFVTYPSSRAVYLDAAGSAVTTLDIGTLGTSTANITTANITSGTVSSAPVNNTDIVNKEYADAIASGIHFHEAVDLATTAALPANTYNNGTAGVGATLTGNANGALSVDSTLTVAGNRVLVKNEAAGANNGVYVVTQVGSAGTPYILTRATDFDSAGTGVDQIDEGDFFLVTSGTANVNTAWVQQTPPPITVGTTAIVFQQFSAPITYTAGTGLSESPAYTFNIANIGTAGTYGSASSVPVITTNAQGQVTGVTPTAIAISGAAVSGNIAGQAGSVANALTAGTFLTSGGTYDGSAARTFAVDATSANTASKVVARDASGDFSAGTITATLSGAATSATTATNLAGGAANRIAYQTGAGATTFAVAPSASNQLLNWNGSAFTWSAGTISGIPLGSNLATLTFGTYLTGTSYNGSSAVTIATNATNANTASTLVARDASGNFSAGTITATLSGNATTSSSTSGNAATATILQTTRAINAVNFNGSADITIPRVRAIDDRTAAPADGTTSYATFGFGSWNNNNSSPYSDFWLMRSYTDASGGADNMVSFRKDALGMRVWQQTYGSATAFTSYKDVAWTDGTNASGTWGINVTGSAATLASGQSNWSGTGVLGNVVGMLAWKNYGNSHVIFDASQSTSPSGGAVNNTNAAVAWSASYPTLMGWNGSSTYGVRVDSARVSDNTTGNAATVGGLAVSGTTNNGANQIVRTDGNGYANFGWINTISGDNSRTALGRIYASQDAYLRYYTPANFNVVLNRAVFNRESNGGTMVAGNIYSIYTGGGALIMYLPTAANTAQGDVIVINNLLLTWAGAAFTVGMNTNTRLMNLNENMICNINVGSIVLMCSYHDGTFAYWNVAPGG